MLFGVDKALGLGNGPDFLLAKGPQGELGVGQLLLGHGIEHIALVLLGVWPLQQEPAASFALLNPGIVAGHHVANAQFPGPTVHPVEFQVAVAVNAGIGCTAPLISRYKPIHDLPAEVLFEVEHVVGHPQPGRHSPGILYILQGTAGSGTGYGHVLIFIQPHGGPHAVIPRPLHEIGRYRAIHSATHGNEGAVWIVGFYGKHLFHVTKLWRFPGIRSQVVAPLLKQHHLLGVLHLCNGETCSHIPDGETAWGY